ncbi:MAG: hypothetical protein FWH15_08250 [Betaproteobacteria bacterium]|nr:hypothetical protein [Betaproteobacteria bacterium]
MDKKEYKIQKGHLLASIERLYDMRERSPDEDIKANITAIIKNHIESLYKLEGADADAAAKAAEDETKKRLGLDKASAYTAKPSAASTDKPAAKAPKNPWNLEALPPSVPYGAGWAFGLLLMFGWCFGMMLVGYITSLFTNSEIWHAGVVLCFVVGFGFWVVHLYEKYG